MVKDVHKEYDSGKRIQNGLMPGLGPLYLLGSYIGHRWRNGKEIREARSKLKEIAGDFSEPENVRELGEVAMESVYRQAKESSERMREQHYSALRNRDEQRQGSVEGIKDSRYAALQKMGDDRRRNLAEMERKRYEALQRMSGERERNVNDSNDNRSEVSECRDGSNVDRNDPTRDRESGRERNVDSYDNSSVPDREPRNDVDREGTADSYDDSSGNSEDNNVPEGREPVEDISEYFGCKVAEFIVSKTKKPKKNELEDKVSSESGEIVRELEAGKYMSIPGDYMLVYMEASEEKGNDFASELENDLIRKILPTVNDRFSLGVSSFNELESDENGAYMALRKRLCGVEGYRAVQPMDRFVAEEFRRVFDEKMAQE